MRRLLLCAAIILPPGLAAAEDIALVLGNARFAELDRLSRGAEVVDAAQALATFGFALDARANAPRADVAEALALYVDQLPEAERIVIVLSGRFATDGARTWFMTADAPVPDLFSVGGQLSVDALLTTMAVSPGQAVLILGHDVDAAEPYDPWLREGIGALDVPQGVTVLIGGPRDVAQFIEGPLAVAGTDLAAAVAEDGQLAAFGYLPRMLPFMPGALVEAPPAPDPAAQGPDPAIEDALWQGAVALDTVDAYRNYLSRYPLGRYADQAEEAISAILSEPNRDARLAEEALNLARSDRRDIQEALDVLDFDPRGIDGIFGPGTRRAIANWQQVNGYSQTTYLNAEQIDRLLGQAERRRAEIAAEEERRALEAARADRAYWDETGALGDEAGLRAYLERYPRGQFADVATERLEAIEAEEAEARAQADRTAFELAATANTPDAYRRYLRDHPDGAYVAEAEARLNALVEPEPEAPPVTSDDEARAQEEALGLNRATAQLIEARLEQMGLDVGEVDGRFNNRTRRALAEYQEARGLSVTGYLDELTLITVLADTMTSLN
jgi:peptidoglycan hydrolase-like protein with peptidoglycan-binding domain